MRRYSSRRERDNTHPGERTTTDNRTYHGRWEEQKLWYDRPAAGGSRRVYSSTAKNKVFDYVV